MRRTGAITSCRPQAGRFRLRFAIAAAGVMLAAAAMPSGPSAATCASDVDALESRLPGGVGAGAVRRELGRAKAAEPYSELACRNALIRAQRSFNASIAEAPPVRRTPTAPPMDTFRPSPANSARPTETVAPYNTTLAR